MSRSPQHNEAMRATTRTAVINAALTLFAQNGYAHTTTRRIAREADISTGLLYHYFDGKEDLLRAVFTHSMDRLTATFTEALTNAPPNEQLPTLLRAIFDLLHRDRDFWALFYMLRTQPAINHLLGDAFRLQTEQLRQLFTAELRQIGRADPMLDAYLLYSLVEGTIQQYLLTPDTYPLEAVATRIIDQFSISDIS